jgi:hypothetical protein
MQPFARFSHLLDSLAYGLGQWVIDNPVAAGAALCAVLFALIWWAFRVALAAHNVSRREW